MTKIIEKTKQSDVHSHIDKAYPLFADRLPANYVDKVFLKIPNDKTLTSGIIRNIRNRVSLYPVSRIDVIIALVEIANEYQEELSANLKKLEKHTA
jgi:hypothetical protein